MRGEEMRRFWDRRASENALYFVDNRLDYGDPDEASFWKRGAADLDALLAAADAEMTPGDRVVEIGCGVGRLTRAIAESASWVKAIDVSEQMLELARFYNDGLPNVEWILGDGESLAPVEDSSADVCLSHVVFQHIPDPAVTLNYVREMGRVLVPGGWAAFQVSDQPLVHKPRRGLERVGSLLRAAARRGPRGQLHPAWRGSATDLAELRKTAASAGMDTENVFGEGTQFCVVRLRRR